MLRCNNIAPRGQILAAVKKINILKYMNYIFCKKQYCDYAASTGQPTFEPSFLKHEVFWPDPLESRYLLLQPVTVTGLASRNIHQTSLCSINKLRMFRPGKGLIIQDA
jgi:hypothetical protein